MTTVPVIDIKLYLFGAFRKYESKGTPISFQVHESMSVKMFKKRLADRLRELFPDFTDEQLIEDSAIADETRVLSQDHFLTGSCNLLILPPVCGG